MEGYNFIQLTETAWGSSLYWSATVGRHRLFRKDGLGDEELSCV